MLSARLWNFLRRANLAAVVVLPVLLGVWGGVPSAQAQTAVFSGTTITLGSGFSNPFGVAVDGSGNVFVADPANNAVKEILAVNGSIPASPTINTIGSGFSNPQGVAVDSFGNVFVADSGHNAVKEILAVNGSIPASPTINTLFTGFSDPIGVAVDGRGNVFVADSGHSAVKEIVAVNGSIPTSPTAITLGSGFSNPQGVAVDGRGNVFVADSNGVEEIVAGTGGAATGTVNVTSTVNPLGSGFNEPGGVAVDGGGNVFVADESNNAVKEIVAGTGGAATGTVNSASTVNTLGSGFSAPAGVAVDGRGNVFVGDADNNAVEEIELNGVNFGSVAVAIATPPTLTLQFTFTATGTIGAPTVLTQGAPLEDFKDAGTGSCTTNGAAHTYAVGDSCTVVVSFTPAHPGQRYGAVELSAGTAVIASANVFGIGTGPQITFGPGTQSTVGSGFSGPSGVAVDSSGNVFVTDFNNGLEEILAVNGVVSSSSMVNTPGSGFSLPEGVAVDGRGNVFVANFDGGVDEIVAGTGGAASGTVNSTSTVNPLGSGFFEPTGVAVDGRGNVFVADTGHNVVKEILAVNGSIPASPTINTVGSNFSQPADMAVDGSGNVFVADSNGVEEIVAGTGGAASGTVNGNSTVNPLGSGFNGPLGVAVDGSGNVFVADTFNNAVKEILAVNGVVSSNSTVNPLGSGFSEPAGVAVDGSGNVFVADFANTRIEELDYADPPTLTFQTPTADGTTDTTDGIGGVMLVTITNDGNEPLTAVSPGLSVTANFTQGGTPTDCTASFSLAEDASCNLSIEFAPVTPASGTVHGSVVLTDNNLNATPTPTQTIPLVGTAVEVSPTVAAISPSFGPTAGGTTVTISGTDFTAATRVSFGGAPATNLTVVSDTTITVASPAGTGTVDVTVTAPGGTSATSPDDRFTYVRPLTLPSATLPAATAANAYNQTLTASGGTPPYTYAITAGALPSGLALSGGVISGTPITAGSSNFTVTVTDANSTTATASFSLTINPAVAATQTIPSKMLTEGHAAAFTPVTGSGGTGTLTYSIALPLPSGLSLSPMTGAISGAPGVTLPATTFTVTVTDANGATASNSFILTINSVVTAAQTIPSKMLTEGHATPFTPVTGGGGTNPLAYSISPTLPAGLSLSPMTGAISGAPSATLTATTFTVTVTDANGATASNTFSLTINGPVAAATVIASIGETINQVIQPVKPVNGSGGTGTLTYSETPTLPPAMAMDPGTGEITGLPTVETGNITYTVTVTDANGATATATFQLTINGSVTASTAIASKVLTQNQAVTPFTPVNGGGGTTPLGYSIAPGLPMGLSLSPTTGTISGAPSVISAATTYTVTVRDANGATATSTFSLTVNSAVVATQAVAAAVLTQSHAATPFTPVTGSGGTGTLTYSISPGLPAGLSISSTSGAIGGTPSAASAAATYTVTVTDANGATATATFSLTVDSAVAATTSIASTELTFYQATAGFTPVTGTGGDAPLVYSVAPMLPAGLAFNAGTGAITGTPTAVVAATTYTVTVTDANSATATAMFSLGVNKQASQTTVSASASSATPVQTVTLTATVSATIAGTATMPSGTVTFYNNGTALMSEPVAAGVAQLTTLLPAGATASITATYSGDGNFLTSTSSTSATVMVAALDFTFTNTGTSAYTAAPGAMATYSFGLSPLYGSYAGAVSFTVTGLPAGATASFTPSTVAADSGATPVVMTVQTASATAQNKSNSSPFGRGIVLAFLLLPFVAKRSVREKLKSRMLLLVLLMAGVTATLTGCGSTSGFVLQSPQTYTLTVTATSGTLQHSEPVTLIVQ